jgi:D-glycero-D-manno-heptose 1,7-bisphosphate phosphatase
VFPWAGPAVRKLNEAGLPVVVITNQGGVAMGYFPEVLVEDINSKIRSELNKVGAILDAVYYCPHHPNGVVEEYRRQCQCRKPAPGLLLRAARELDIDLERSFLVGDRFRDTETAFGIGAKGILVLTGYGKGEYEYQRGTWPRMPDHIAADLGDAVDWILLQLRS